MIDLEETGKQIGEKLFALLTTEQKRELIRNIINNEMYNTELNFPTSIILADA